MNASPSRPARTRRAASVVAPPRRGSSSTASTSGSSTARGPADSSADRSLLDPDALAALEEQRDFLLASIRDLDREYAAGDIDDADYESLKDDYTARAAAVIRSIESRHAAFAGQRRRRSLGRTAVTVSAVILLAAVAGALVARSAGERAPGQTASGNLGQTSRDLLLAAQDQMGRGDVLGAIQTYDQVLKVDPGNVEAMAYRGWLLRLSSFSATEAADRELLQDQALQWLTKALEIDPDYADARVFRAIVHRDRDELEAARADLAALDLGAIPPFMRPLVESLRADLEGPSGTGSVGQSGGGR